MSKPLVPVLVAEVTILDSEITPAVEDAVVEVAWKVAKVGVEVGAMVVPLK